MSCAFDKEKLTGYFDGELDPDERSEVEGHISSCSECLRDLGEIKSAALLVRELPRHRAPRSIAESVSREIAAAGGAARFRVLRGTLLWATAAAAALLIAVNVVYFTGVSKRSAPEAASARRPSAATALATRVSEPAPEDRVNSFGKGPAYDHKSSEKSGAPADKDRPAAPESAVRRAADKDASNAFRKAEDQGDRFDAGLKGDAPAAPPPAPAAPPAAASAPTGTLKDAEEMNRLRERNEGAREVAKVQKKEEAFDLEKAKKADDGKKAELAMFEEKGLEKVGAKKAGPGTAAGEQAGGGGGPAVALTLAAADPAAARSRVEAILQKLGARMEPAPAPAPAQRAVVAGGRGAAPKPLTAALSEKQLAEFRKEIQKEKKLLLVEGRGAEARKRVEETFRAKAAAKTMAEEPAAVTGADRKAREEAESENPAKPAAPVAKEAPAAAEAQGEALQRQQAEPTLIRVTFDFAALEAPAAEPK